jgi:hypothetical protein
MTAAIGSNICMAWQHIAVMVILFYMNESDWYSNIMNVQETIIPKACVDPLFK